jgi:hypothetical protein
LDRREIDSKSRQISEQRGRRAFGRYHELIVETGWDRSAAQATVADEFMESVRLLCREAIRKSGATECIASRVAVLLGKWDHVAEKRPYVRVVVCCR